MKKAYMIILSVIFTVGLTGCGKENKTEITGERTEKYTESVPTKEYTESVSTEGYAESVPTEELTQSSERVFSEDCIGVFTISINPEVELGIDKSGNVLSVVFRNEDAETAYKDLSLEGMAARDAMRLIVETANEKGYLKDDEEVTLTYGSTGNASVEEARGMIDSARDTVMDKLNELGKESIVALEMKNYAQDTSDICDLCFGVGSIVCEQCGGLRSENGMVKCDLCMGTGTYDDGHIPEGGDEPADDGLCRTCRGTGIMTIQAQTCYICNGTGLCINCGGSGIDPELDDQGNSGSCHACGGSGDCLQEVCEGGVMVERHETCRDCGGSGQDTGNFSGPDVGEDSDNDPSGVCNRCGGTGYMECNGCGGTLIETCYRCNGTGINKN